MRSVLLVDDEYFIRVRVRKCVDWQALGFDMVADCESGREALELLEAHPFDLVVLDISMPIMDGLSLCREIRARGYDSQLVILTGYDKFEYAKSALYEAGANRLVSSTPAEISWALEEELRWYPPQTESSCLANPR